MFKGGNRGQITIFVIIGILLIGAVALIFLFQSNYFKPSISTEEAEKVVAANVNPVKAHVEECMRFVSMKTLNTLGRQGGYVLPKAERYSLPTSVMAEAPIMPYALFYSKSKSSYMTLLPSVNEMKENFASFMEANPDFEDCLEGFKTFNGIVDIKVKDSMKIDRNKLDFGEKSGFIVIAFTYPLDISKSRALTSITDYEIKIPINLARINEHATVIINSEIKGDSVTKILQDMALLQEQRLRENSKSDTIITSYVAYDFYDSEDNGVSYNAKNTLYKLEYNNPELEEPYYFYFLAGEQ